MYHSPSRRTQVVRLVIIYSLMSIAVTGLVAALVFIILGYQFNRTDGRIEQGGLVQFESRPVGADVTVDGASFGSRTPSKTTLISGQHFVTMQRSGYKAWQKSVKVIPGSVLWLNYARLVPNELKPANVSHFAGVSSTAVSPDKKWMALIENATSSSIHISDLSGDTVKQTTIELPAGSFTRPSAGKTQNFSLTTWDPDSRYLLIKHTYDDNKFEWLVCDTQNSSDTQNITRLLNVDAVKIVFSGNNSKIVYAQIGTDVRRIDIGTATLSRPLVANVTGFSLYKDSTLVFTSLADPDTKKRIVGYYDAGADKIRTVRTYTDSTTVSPSLALGEYFHETYMTIAQGETVEVHKGDFSQPAKMTHVATFAVPGGAEHVSVSKEGRFVIAQHGDAYVVYDIELKKTTSTVLKGASDVTGPLQWLDNYMLWSDRDNMLRLYEFDGANQHDIMPVSSGFSVTLSPNDRYIYGITQAADGTYYLTRVRMILP